MNIIIGLLSIAAGIALWGLAITTLISWVAFCFGTVVIGVLMVIFAPHLLFLPMVISVPGTGLIAFGVARIGGIKV